MSSEKRRRSFSPDRHRRQTQARLIVGGLLILLGIGGGLVWLIYGRSAAMTAVVCLLAAAGILGLLWLILTLLERWVKEEEP
jgi:protein-S-isoprenylcysteine O-methyltransferase Ste14